VSNQKDDIEKYLKGKLSPAEMHKLEMQALHDPFLAEALEGADLIDPNQFANDVDSINQKIRSGNAKKYYWPLRIAASIILIASVIYLVVWNNPATTVDQLVLQKNDQVSGDSLPVKENQEEKSEMRVLSDSGHVPTPTPENLLSLKSEHNLSGKSLAKPEQDKKQSQPQKISKEATDELVSAAEAVSSEEKDIVAGETQGAELTLSQEFEKADKEKIVAAKRRSAKSEVQKEIAPSPRLLSGAGNNRSMSEDHQAAAQSTIGDEEYQKYLKTNLKYPAAAIDNNISGEVIVSFTVNSDSSLSDFKIDKGIGFGCDEELIRLIKAGPPWIPTRKAKASVNQRVRVSFVFDRPN